MKTTNLRQQLASEPAGEKIQVTKQDYDELKKFETGFESLLASLGELTEPFAGEFAKLKKQINTQLAKLEPSDLVPAAQRADSILCQIKEMLRYTQDMMTQIAGVAKSATEGQRSAMASLTTQVQVETDKKVQSLLASGEYLKKDDLATKIADAVAGAKSKWASEQKTISDRRQILASLKVAAPADDQLAGEEADFTAKKDKAVARAEKLKPFTALKPERITQLCWASSDADFDSVLGDLGAGAAAAGKPGLLLGATPPPAPPADATYAGRAKKLGVF